MTIIYRKRKSTTLWWHLSKYLQAAENVNVMLDESDNVSDIQYIQ